MYEKLLSKLNIENKNTDEYNVPQYIRINTLRIEPSILLERLKEKKIELKKVNFLDYCYEVISSDFALASTEEYLMGFFYIQEAASQFPVQVLQKYLEQHDKLSTNCDFFSDKFALDMCAAPGSKTTQLSQLMQNSGNLIALDINPRRLIALKNNVERMGCNNVIIYNKNGLFANDLDYKYDYVLLDAPCSGNYTLGDYCPRSDDDISKKSAIQKRLIKSACGVLKKNGILLYSTCSLEEKENEDVINWAIENSKLKLLDINSLDLENLDKISNGIIKETKRFFPHINNTQGFFVALLQKI